MSFVTLLVLPEHHHLSSNDMKRPLLLSAMFAVLGLSLFAILSEDSLHADAAKTNSSQQLRWYKGNLHTHSHWSDGDDYLENIGLWYRDHDYQFNVFTDHNVLADKERWVSVEKSKGKQAAYDKLKKNFPDWIEERTVDDKQEVRLRRFTEVAEKLNQPGDFLLIQGEEISDSFHRHPIHMNVSNIVEVIAPRHGESVFETMQNNVDAVVAQRKRTGQAMIIHLNHPNFGYAVTAEDMFRLQGEKFFEVYNGHPGVHNTGDETHASTERIWDIVLAHRLGKLDLPVMYGIAIDDGHNYHSIPSRKSNPGRGWVMVKAKELTAETMVLAMEAGDFYSSSGVALRSFENDGNSLSVVVNPVEGETYKIEFVGTMKDANLEGEPILNDKDEPLPTTHRYSPEIGKVLQSTTENSASYKFTGDELYVRARITSSADHPNPSEVGDKKQAWVQPVVPGK